MNLIIQLLVVLLLLMSSGVRATADVKSDEGLTPNRLSSLEKNIVKAIQSQLPQATKTLEHVVNINSGTMNFSGVEEVGQVFIDELKALGFSTQWVDGTSFNRAGHVVASYGTKGPKILMIGHLDTVFAKNDVFQRFEKIDERYIAGPGITDMKGGDVIIVEALRALKSLNLLDNVHIKVVMTGDEERSGRPLSESKKALIDAAKWADIALGFEDADGDIKTGVVSRRGAISWQLDIAANAAHSSQIFTESVGFGASYELARIVNAFREQLIGIENLTFNPGIMAAGTRVEYDKASATMQVFGKTNVVAKSATAVGDIRALTTEQLAKAQKIMQNIVAQHLTNTKATLVFNEGYPPMAPTKNNYKLLSYYSEVSDALGYGKISPVNPRKAGAADISFAANHVDMAIDGLGLMGTGGHTKNEVADMSSFNKNIEKAAILIHRLSLRHKAEQQHKSGEH